MNVDCKWMDQRLEAFFCDTLDANENRVARTHVAQCSRCKETIEGIRSVDPLVATVFKQNLAIAGMPPRRRPLPLIGSVAAAAVAATVFIVLRLSPAPPLQPAPAPVPVASNPNPQVVPKVPEETAAIERAKPDSPVDRPSPVSPAASALGTTEQAPEFLVSDPGGYSRSLSDFRNYILIFGTWTANQPQTAANLEKVYQTFGSNTRIRILGISRNMEPKPAHLTFPAAFNQGSRLLGAADSELFVLDGNGTVQMRTSLLQDSDQLLNALRSKLNELKQ